MDQQALEQRLRRLEWRNRFLTTAFSCLLLVFFVLAVRAPMMTTTVLRAERFELIDEAGNIHAELDVHEGQVGIHLKDEEGNNRLSLTHNTEETALYIKDAKGNNRLAATQSAQGGGSFTLHGPEMKGAAVLYLQGEGVLSFYDDAGQVANQFPVQQP